MLLSLSLVALTLSPAAAEEDLCQTLPAGCVLVVEAPHLAQWLQGGLKQPWIERIRELPPVKAALENAPLQPEGALALGTLFWGQPILPSLAELCSGGVAFGLTMEGIAPLPFLALEAKSASTLETALKRLANKFELQQKLPAGSLWEQGVETHGARLWDLGNDLAFAQKGARLLVAPTAKHVRQMLNAAAENASITSRPAWRAAQAGRDHPAKARVWIDLEGIEKLGASRPIRNLRQLVHQPAAHFVLGSEFARVGSAQSVWLGLDGNKNHVSLVAQAFGVAPHVHEGLAPAKQEHLAGPLLPRAGERELLRGQFFRNFDALFEHRLEIFPTRAQPQFAEVAANLALFFSGGDPEEELFPNLAPWIGVIAREVPLDPQPDLPLPGVCFVAKLHNPEILGPRLTAGFQTAIGLVNVDAAQKREPSLLLQLEQHHGIPITSARYLPPLAPPGEGAGIDARYNLEPACALVGDQFLVGTHVDLVRDIALQLQRKQFARPSEPYDALTLHGEPLLRALAANSDALILNAVLTEGKTSAQARLELDGLLAFVQQVDALHTSVRAIGSDALEISLQLAMTP